MAKLRPFQEIQALATEYGEQMGRHCFDGEIAAFHATFKTYLAHYSDNDPFGRLLLQNKVSAGMGLISFQSTSTDRDELIQQSKRRWDAWMSVLPLDLQVGLLAMESAPRFPAMVDPSTLKWEQWDAILASANPEKAYLASALHPSRNVMPTHSHDPGQASSWASEHRHLAAIVHQRAMQLVAWKAWPELVDWMKASGMHAREAVSNVHVHHDGPYSHGSTLADAIAPLPFWATGLFCGASDASFWEIMHRFGGPCGPGEVFQAPVPATNEAFATPIAHRARELVVFPASLRSENPLSWVRPCVQLEAPALERIEQTLAVWSSQSMHEDVALPGRAPKAAARL